MIECINLMAARRRRRRRGSNNNNNSSNNNKNHNNKRSKSHSFVQSFEREREREREWKERNCRLVIPRLIRIKRDKDEEENGEEQ